MSAGSGTVLHTDRLPELVAAMRRAEEAAADLARALRDLADADRAVRALEVERGLAATLLAASAAEGDRRRVRELSSDLLVPQCLIANERFRAALRRLDAASLQAVHPAGS